MYKEDYCGIYCIENIIDGKKYIGQAKGIKARWMHHKSELRNNSHHNNYLQNAWNKYGENNFIFNILEQCDCSKLDERECYYIDMYNTTNRAFGYNLKTGGQNGGCCWADDARTRHSQKFIGHAVSEESRRKISKNHADISGANNPMYGKTHTQETKNKISTINKGRKSAKRNCAPVYCVEMNKVFIDATEAAKELNIDGSAILKVCRGERQTCGGYHWKFYTIEE